jgi:hypothetical protein
MFSTKLMQHFITTPFYVQRHFTGQSEPTLAAPAWLESRLRLFEDYCLPSVTGQSDQNFEWFIYFDVSTPVEYLERISSLTCRYPNISIKLCSSFGWEEVSRDVVAKRAASTKWIITTRLDNDDGLHRDFVSTLHSAVEEREEFLNFPQGIILYSSKCFVYRHPSNAFISFVEPATSPRTAWAVAHVYAAKVAPVRQLISAPAFLQVIHGANISNKPRGTRINSRKALVGFDTIPVLRKAENDETQIGIMLENATIVMLWRLRDSLVSLARAMRR